MRTLHLLRNIAVLFILVMMLLASRPRPAAAHANGIACGLKPGYTNCSVDLKSGKCTDLRCKGSKACWGVGCVF